MSLQEASVEQSNAGNTADNAHRIKGAALNLELKEIGALAKDMEGRARNGSVYECAAIIPKLKNELNQIVKLAEELNTIEEYGKRKRAKIHNTVLSYFNS